jgi:hypothetical protein
VGTARLTDRIPADRAVAASVSRREITDVLQDADTAAELRLDVVGGEAARTTINMTWSREDLEKILAAASGDDVVLTFDRNELAAALDDVEAHGMRARAALFAVAAAGALGSGASIANAMIPGGGEGGGSTPAAASQVGGGNAAFEAQQARSEAMNAQYGLSGASDATVTDASTGGYVTPAQSGSAADSMVTDSSTGGYVTPAQADTSQSALQARSEAMNAQYGLGGASDATVTDASTGGYATPGHVDPATAALQARGEAMNAQYGLGDRASDAIVTDASTGGGYAATPTGSSGGIELQSPSTDDALIAGAALLTIAGAAFAVRRGRGAAPRPA